MLCSHVQRPLHIHTCKCKSLFCATVDILSSFFPFFFFPSSYALCHTFISECDCFPLQCFYEDCTQSNQELALSQLMQSLHCRSSIFPYDVRERRPAQEAVLSCVGMHSIQNSSH
jgi:hypothetical protein